MQFLHQKQKIFFFILFVFLTIGSIFSFQIITYAQTPWVCPSAPSVHYSSESVCNSNCAPSSCTDGSSPGVPPPPPGPPPPPSDTPSSPADPSSGPSESGKLKLYNPLGTIDSFAALAAAIFKAIVIIAIPLTVIFLIWAGVLFVTARGNEEQLKRAKKVFVWSVIGAMVIVASWVIAVAINTSVQDL